MILLTLSRNRFSRASITVRPARMLGVTFLFAFGAILFTLLFDPEDRLSPIAAVPLLATTFMTGATETWGNYVHVGCRGITRVNWAGLATPKWSSSSRYC